LILLQGASTRRYDKR